MIKFLGGASLILLTLQSAAQPLGRETVKSNADSLREAREKYIPPILKYTHGETDITGSLIYYNPDTTLDYLQLVNPAVKYFNQDLANIGSAAKPQIFQWRRTTDADLGIHAFDAPTGGWTPDSIRYYKTNKRFSEFTYHQGGGPEQRVKITFAQNITRNWNAGFDFRRMASRGFLASSGNTSGGKTFHTNFDFFTSLNSADQRYHLFAYTLWNSIKNNVNGGIVNDSLVNTNSFSNAELSGVSVNLGDASQRWRNHYFGLTHYYDFLKTGKDSVASPWLRWTHRVVYESGSYAYSDNSTDSSFYRDYFFSSATNDSLHYHSLTNTISFTEFLKISSFESKLSGGLGAQSYFLGPFADTSLSNYFVEAFLNMQLKELSLSGGGKYVFSGANQGNFYAKAMAQYRLGSLLSVAGGVEAGKQSPTMVQNQYVSNHYIWLNDFKDVKTFVPQASLALEKYHLAAGVKNFLINDYIYFGEAIAPQQTDERLNVLQVFGEKNFLFYKFKWNNRLWWQKTQGSALHLPEWAVQSTFIYESWFFGGKLLGQAGVDVHYVSGYYADAFSPAVAQFYLQQQAKAGDYPLADVFINFKVKTARVFFKFQNAGDGVFADNYYLTPHYPMPGMIFLFGFNWRFFD